MTFQKILDKYRKSAFSERECHRMDYGTLPNNHSQRIVHPQRPQRMGHRSWQSAVYPGFVAKHYQRECANCGSGEGFAGGEVLNWKY